MMGFIGEEDGEEASVRPDALILTLSHGEREKNVTVLPPADDRGDI